MLPFKGGAHKREGYKTRRVLSVRTWLDEGKLSDLDRERMGGLDKMDDVLVHDYDAAKEHFLRWIKGNARLWQFSDITLGDQDCLPTEGPKIPAISSQVAVNGAQHLSAIIYLYRPSKLQCFGKINRFLDETT